MKTHDKFRRSINEYERNLELSGWGGRKNKFDVDTSLWGEKHGTSIQNFYKIITVHFFWFRLLQRNGLMVLVGAAFVVLCFRTKTEKLSGGRQVVGFWLTALDGIHHGTVWSSTTVLSIIARSLGRSQCWDAATRPSATIPSCSILNRLFSTATGHLGDRSNGLFPAHTTR